MKVNAKQFEQHLIAIDLSWIEARSVSIKFQRQSVATDQKQANVT